MHDIDLEIEGYFQNILLESLINSRPKKSLKECLKTLSIDTLLTIGLSHEVELDVILSKPKLVRECWLLIMYRFIADVEYLDINEFALLKELLDVESIEISQLKFTTYYSLVKLGFVYLFGFNDKIYPVIPKEIRILIYKAINEGYEGKIELNCRKHLLAKALTNLYGIFEIEQFAKVWNEYNVEQTTIEQASEFFVGKQFNHSYYWIDEDWIVSSYFDDEEDEEYLELKDESSWRPYYMPSNEEIEFYSKNEYNENSKECKSVERFLKGKLSISKERFEDLFDELMFLCLMDAPVREIFELLNEADVVFDGENVLNKFMQLLMELMNNTRKWVLRGHISSELFETMDKPNLRVLPQNPLEARVEKIGRNELCNCGSGKKFKKCCGKVDDGAATH